jgi:hypothetical protein
MEGKKRGYITPKTRIKLVCLTLDEKGESKPFYMREDMLYPSQKPCAENYPSFLLQRKKGKKLMDLSDC